jgi:hypothetical protein
MHNILYKNVFKFKIFIIVIIILLKFKFKNIKCEINLTCIDIILNDYNHKYSNIILYPMIDNNYYTDEKIKLYCSLNNINVIF